MMKLLSVLSLAILPILLFADVYRVPVRKTKLTTVFHPDSKNKFDAYDTNVVHMEMEATRFLGPVTIGSSVTQKKNILCVFCLPESEEPAENVYNVVYDTGSSGLWVFEERSRKRISLLSDGFPHQFYQKTTSYRTYGEKPKRYIQTYAEAPAIRFEGLMGYETVKLGGVSLDNAAFVAVDRVKGDIVSNFGKDGVSFDGILGLGLPPTARNGTKPPLIQMVEEKLLDKPVFSVHFAKNGKEGEVLFGGIDASLLEESEIKYTTLSNNQRWQIPVDRIKIGGKELLALNDLHALIDTGCSGIILPKEMELPLLAVMPQWIDFPRPVIMCSDRHKLPVLDFVINGNKYSLSGTDYFVKSERLEAWFCQFNIMYWRGDGTITNVVLGYPFIQKFYTVFDYGKRRLGFGTAVHAAASPTTSPLTSNSIKKRATTLQWYNNNNNNNTGGGSNNSTRW